MTRWDFLSWEVGGFSHFLRFHAGEKSRRERTRKRINALHRTGYVEEIERNVVEHRPPACNGAGTGGSPNELSETVGVISRSPVVKHLRAEGTGAR